MIDLLEKIKRFEQNDGDTIKLAEEKKDLLARLEKWKISVEERDKQIQTLKG